MDGGFKEGLQKDPTAGLAWSTGSEKGQRGGTRGGLSGRGFQEGRATPKMLSWESVQCLEQVRGQEGRDQIRIAAGGACEPA